MTCPAQIAPRLCGVVVTYHPAPSVRANLALLRPQVTELVVVDNTEGPVPEALRGCETELQLNLLRMGRNTGIASALNAGIQHALKAGFPWVATFDQDSTTAPGFAEGMNQALQSCPWAERVAVVSPVHCNTEAENLQVAARLEKPRSVPIAVAMTSGSVLRTDAFRDVGQYDESLFIDYVDYEWCLRARRRGWRIIQACRVPLLHQLGIPKNRSLLGIPVHVKSHRAWRRYYIMRNRILVYKRHGITSPAWALRDFGWIFLEFAKMLMLEDGKSDKLVKAGRGLLHGVVGRTGRVIEPEP